MPIVPVYDPASGRLPPPPGILSQLSEKTRVTKRALPIAAALAAYLLAALAYVFITPLWQTPDEPAHYNYIRHLVTEASLPVLEPGDYPAAYLEELKAGGFPPGSDIAPIRYEGHQPPLYYVLAAPVLAAFIGNPVSLQVHALRLFTVLVGLASLVVTYSLGLGLWPGRRARAAALAATVALIPMYTAVSAAINNDALAVALTAAVGLLVLRTLTRSPIPRRRLTALGVLLGLCLLTKTTAYITVPLVVLALVLHGLRHRTPWRGTAQAALALALPAALLWLPWIGRNLATYGLSDPLGLARHDSIVTGQLTTAELLAELSPLRLLIEGITLTFKSFWGVFGWMGVPMHEQVYLVLAAASLTAVAGLGVGALQWVIRRAPRWEARAQVALLAAWGLFSICGLVWYNMKFVQYQGRYLYAALPVWAAAMVAGMISAREHPLPTSLAMGAIGALALAIGWARGDVPGLLLALLAAAAIGLFAWRWAARRWSAVSSLPLWGLWGLSMAGALYYVNRFL